MGDGSVGGIQPGVVLNSNTPDPIPKTGEMKGIKVSQIPHPTKQLNAPDQLQTSFPSDQSVLQRNVSQLSNTNTLPSVKQSPTGDDTKGKGLQTEPGNRTQISDSDTEAVTKQAGAGLEAAATSPQEKAEKYIEHKRLSDGKVALNDVKANLDKLSKHKFPKDIVVKMTLKGESEPISIIPPDKRFKSMTREQQESLINRAMGVLDKRLKGDLAQFKCDDLKNQLGELKLEWVQQEQDRAAMFP